MKFEVNGVDIVDGDVWIVEINYGVTSTPYHHILRAEIETQWLWASKEDDVPHSEVPSGVSWWSFGSDVAQVSPGDGAIVMPIKRLYRHQEGQPKCL